MPTLSSVLVVIITIAVNTSLFTYFTIAEEPMYPFFIILFFASIGTYCVISYLFSMFTNNKLELPPWMK